MTVSPAHLRAPAGAVLFRPGDLCERFLRVTHGRVRVQAVGPTGREIVLYRLEPGDACVVTTACLLGGSTYPAEAVAETDVAVESLSKAAFDAALSEPAFRAEAFAGFGARLAGLMAMLGEVAFERIDVRLARHLLALADPSGAVSATHEALAAELGTAREVVSRVLKRFEAEGWVTLGRGRVRLARRAPLSHLAGDPAAW